MSCLFLFIYLLFIYFPLSSENWILKVNNEKPPKKNEKKHVSTKSTQANSFPCEKGVIISRPKIGPLQRPVLPSLGLPAARMLHMCHKWGSSSK
jgi:hypothetical protein